MHAQLRPKDLDWSGQRIVVVGSGATAITLVTALAERAAHVTMLQRSPTYLTALPRIDRMADVLRRWLPAGVAHQNVRERPPRPELSELLDVRVDVVAATLLRDEVSISALLDAVAV